MFTAQWNTGYLVGMGIILILQLICIFAGAILGFIFQSWIAPITGLICILLLGIIGTFVAFPFSSVYHRYQPISGTVQSVNSRFLGDGSGGTNQNFVVTINGTAYRVDDTRGSLLKKGSKVTLMCTKTFQFNAASGWVCNWGKFGLNK